MEGKALQGVEAQCGRWEEGESGSGMSRDQIIESLPEQSKGSATYS